MMKPDVRGKAITDRLAVTKTINDAKFWNLETFD